jgi:hypothetical protein
VERHGGPVGPELATSVSLGFAAQHHRDNTKDRGCAPETRGHLPPRIDGGRAGKPLSRPGGNAAMGEGFSPACLRQLETRRFPR